MLRIAAAGLRARLLRTTLLALMIMLGVGVFGGSLVYADTAKAAFFDDLARSARGVDVYAHLPEWLTPVPGSLDAVAHLPGVAHADQRTTAPLGLIGHNGRVISNNGVVGSGMAAPAWPEYAPYTLTGRSPRGAGEVLVHVPTAAREHIAIGDTVSVVGADGRQQPELVVGLADFGVTDVFADRSVVVLTRDELTALAGADTSTGGDIVIAAQPGTDVAALREQVDAALDPGFVVLTGDQLRNQLATDAVKYVSSFLKTLQVTAIVALAVALLVAYNAFGIMVAQRATEHALLRAVGASRRQLAKLVAIESLLIGACAGVGSVVLSVGTGFALLWAREHFGGGMPDYGLVVSPVAVIAPIVAAIVASVISATLPALVASRVSPLAALRDASDPNPALAGRGRLGRAAGIAAGLIAGASGAYVVASSRGRGFDGLPTMAAGAMVIFAAIIAGLPLVVKVLGAPLRWVLSRVLGATGRLAVTNALRHPVRCAATAAAVAVGIAPMTAFAILLGTAQVQGQQELAENFPLDFAVAHPRGTASAEFAESVVTRLRERGEFAVVVRARVVQVDPSVCCARLGTAEPGALGNSVPVEVRAGQLDGLPRGTAAVSVSYAVSHGVSLGDTITVGTAAATWRARLVATYDATPIAAEVLVNWDDFAAAGLTGRESLLIRRAPTVTAAAARTVLEDEFAADPLAVILSSAERSESLAQALGRRLTQFQVLLGLSLLIAMLGIANSLSLSVLERTRELAVLRSLGQSRRQVYGSLLTEAFLVAVIGAAVGLCCGVGFGWLLGTELLNHYGHGSPSLPVGMIAGYAGLSMLAAAAATVLPARRASRVSVAAVMARDA